MRAAQFAEHSDRGIPKYDDFPGPEVDPDEIFVDVRTASFSHFGVWTRQGLPGVELRMPYIPDSDTADVVTEVDKRVTRLGTGDCAAFIAGIVGGGDKFSRKGDPTPMPNFHIVGEHIRGVHAKFAVIPKENLVPVPEGVPWEVAGLTSFVFWIAWRILIDRGEPRPGEKMLVLGTSGGVGHVAIQTIDYVGAEIYATVSIDEKLEYASGYGADHVINYEEGDFSKEIQTLTDGRGVDMVVDHIGETTYKQSLRSLVKGGRVVTCGATTGPDPGVGLNYIFWNQFSVIGSTMATPGEVDGMLDLVWDGISEPRIHETLPMNEIDRAHELIEERQGFGEMVVIPDGEL